MHVTQNRLRIALHADDLGQLLDGLRLRAEAWAKTADFLESGYRPDSAFVCEECSNPDEAGRIARHYERIIKQIEQQVQKQGGWS